MYIFAPVCGRIWNGVYCPRPTAPSDSVPVDRVQTHKAPLQATTPRSDPNLIGR